MLEYLYVPLVRQNQNRMDSPNWSALARESRPPHWFSTAICSAVHRPNTSLIASPSAASASAEIGPGPPPPPPLDAAMGSRGWDGGRLLGFFPLCCDSCAVAERTSRRHADNRLQSPEADCEELKKNKAREICARHARARFWAS